VVYSVSVVTTVFVGVIVFVDVVETNTVERGAVTVAVFFAVLTLLEQRVVVDRLSEYSEILSFRSLYHRKHSQHTADGPQIARGLTLDFHHTSLAYRSEFIRSWWSSSGLPVVQCRLHTTLGFGQFHYRLEQRHAGWHTLSLCGCRAVHFLAT
jgi:hypothetical protein